MWGRAGRRRDGIAIYVAGEDALDQFFCRHPDEFLARPVEAAILDHTNERIQTAHLLAAAFEAPLGGTPEQPGGADDEILGERWRERADALVGAGKLRRGRDGRYLPRGPGFPAGEISLRSASLDSVAVVERASGELLGQVEAERAFSTVHPGAIYLHLGRSYEVAELDVEGRRAIVDAFDGDWYTQPKKETMVFIEADGGAARIGPRGDERSSSRFGEVSVTEQVIAYQRKSLTDHEVIDLVALDLPEQNFPTQALWYVLADELAGPAGAADGDVQLGALHATEHSQIAVLPLLAMCDRWDIGGLSTNVHFQTGLPTIFIYDGHPGGVGISRRGYDEFERLVADAARLVGECPCESGCPSCVQSPKCGNLNEPLHKAGALELMDAIINLIAAERRPAARRRVGLGFSWRERAPAGRIRPGARGAATLPVSRSAGDDRRWPGRSGPRLCSRRVVRGRLAGGRPRPGGLRRERPHGQVPQRRHPARHDQRLPRPEPGRSSSTPAAPRKDDGYTRQDICPAIPGSPGWW